jgi:hypothetical protein
MSSMEPPKVARWILKHFGSSPNNEAVIGDLDERYNTGRSAAGIGTKWSSQSW